MNAQTPVRPSALQLQNQNLQARSIIKSLGVPMIFPVYSSTLQGTILGQVINIVPKNVGFLKRFYIEIVGTTTAGAAETLTRTKLGMANILSNVQFNDLSNQVRINTTGWHLNMLATVRRGMAFGAAFVSDNRTGFASNFTIMNGQGQILPTMTDTFRFFYEIPITYSDDDFRGGIYLSVVSAVAGLQLTINPNFFVGSAADEVPAVYKSNLAAALGTLTAVTITVYQEIIDQIPMANGQPILPIQDVTTAYLLNQTAFSGLNVGQDFGMPYANFRQFLSSCLVYDNQGLNPGTDITYFAMQIANYTNLIKYDPFVNALKVRNMIGTDFPIGTYYFDHRAKPIDTIQFGNQQLIVNPSNVAGGTSQVLLGLEALAIINQVIQAGSLANS